MQPGFDHVTIVVTDLDEATRFFELLGFEMSHNVVVSGDAMSKYMGIADWKADHVTLALAGAETHQEVQLLRFHNPPVQIDAETGNLARTGFNHVCFRVDDIDAMIERLQSGGIGIRNDVMTFHDRKLVFLRGPGGVTIELAQWLAQPTAP
jgi:catechol 2,3-dioxygenase-like lactoylglutathione lyase family enzyme